MICRAHLRHLE